MRDFDLRAGPHHREFRMHVAIFGDTIINARRMRTMVTVLSVCVLAPVCWLHIKSIYNTFSVAIGFLLGLSDFEPTDLSKMPLFPR